MFNSTPSEVQPSLLDVQLAFAHWRKHRTGREKTPERLRQLAIALLDHHPVSHVCQALGLNSTTLRQWTYPADDSCIEHSAEFVALPTVSTDASSPVALTDDATHTIHLPNGVAVSCSGDVALYQILNAANALKVLA